LPQSWASRGYNGKPFKTTPPGVRVDVCLTVRLPFIRRVGSLEKDRFRESALVVGPWVHKAAKSPLKTHSRFLPLKTLTSAEC
jgi:hypothetical protein